MCGRDLEPVDEPGTEHDLRQLVVSIESAPAFLCSFDELEHHGQRCRVRETALGAGGAVADRRERALDRVRRAQMLPMLGREVVEGEQRSAILLQAGGCLLEFQRVGGQEGIEGLLGILARGSHPDVLQDALGLGLLALG